MSDLLNRLKYGSRVDANTYKLDFSEESAKLEGKKYGIRMVRKNGIEYYIDGKKVVLNKTESAALLIILYQLFKKGVVK